MNNRSDFEKYFLANKPFHASELDGYIQKRAYLNPYILEERQLNVSALDVFSRLMMDRIVYLGTEVSDESANILIAQLLYLDSVEEKEISLYINSPGGSCSSGLGIYDTLQNLNSKTHSTSVGLSASFGAVLLACCDHRSALEHSEILIHQPRIMGGGISGTETDMKIQMDSMTRTKETLTGILTKHSSITYDEMYALCERDCIMYPPEALKIGLIDDIINNPDRSAKRWKNPETK